ncbi:MAG TPA: hypothetical protein VKB87_01040 [Myxococcaceae bacterium]|nr:hypothetical protein [Myxococcaceae bacterium]
MEATQQLKQKAREVEERLGPQIEEAKKNLNDLNTRIKSFIRERPGMCLLGALAFGFIVGRIASRR